MIVVPSPIKYLFTLILIFSFFACSKNDNSLQNRGGNPSTGTVISDVVYGSNKDINGNTISLKLDVYIPAGATSTDKYPFVLFVHGGGFTAGDKSSASVAMQNFATAGYVGATIDYRLDSSIDAETEDPCSIDSVTTQKTVYMSVQDAKAAMRFMVANADKYHIDVTKIFMVGHSAGAVTVLNSYYLNQSDFNKLVPGIQNDLGGIDNSDNDLTNTYNVIGIASNSGALPNPNYITSSNVVPMIFFHGGLDSVIPIKQGHAYYCPNSMYIYGSETLYPRVVSLGHTSGYTC